MKFLEEIRNATKVPLKFHWSFILLPLLFIYIFGFFGVFTFGVLFISLLVHEYAHVWMALRQKINVPYVVVMAVGAGAMLDPIVVKYPKKELKIAIVGPASSIILAILLLIFSFISIAIFGSVNNLLLYGVAINILLGVFNFLPIYPMDGGRVLNSILARYFGSIKSVKISAIVSYICSVIGMCLTAWYHQWFLLLIFAVIILFAKQQRDHAIKVLSNI